MQGESFFRDHDTKVLSNYYLINTFERKSNKSLIYL